MINYKEITGLIFTKCNLNVYYLIFLYIISQKHNFEEIVSETL